MSALLPVAEAQARILSMLAILKRDEVPLAQAVGRFSLLDYWARYDQPPFDAAAMDGYAIRSDDRRGPWVVIGEVAAGSPFEGNLLPGHAVRIFTGAKMPIDADLVVIQENVERDGAMLTLADGAPVPENGANVRVRGFDFKHGRPFVSYRQLLTPARLGLLAASGWATVRVPRRARVTLLATGNELVPPGTVVGKAQIYSSAGAMLAALISAATGAEVIDGGIVPDDRAALAAAITAAKGSDLIITIGGASVGDHDLVRPVLADLGARLEFWKVAMRPGKPMLFGRLGHVRVLGLPGNPVAAYVGAVLFVLPLIRAWGGDPDPLPETFTARLVEGIGPNDGRQDYLRAHYGEGQVVAAPKQDSSMLSVLAFSNALIVRAPHAPAAHEGDTVECISLDFVPGVAHTFP